MLEDTINKLSNYIIYLSVLYSFKQPNLGYFHGEILDGLKEVPFGNPVGRILINGANAQTVFTYHEDNSAFAFLAAAEYGKGRMFLAADESYGTWFLNNSGGLEGHIISNIKKWLTKGAGAVDSLILDLRSVNVSTDFSQYRLCFWHHSIQLSGQVVEKLRVFVANGGGLFSAITFWRSEEVEDVYYSNSINKFFETYAGLILTGSYFSPTSPVQIYENLADVSNNYHKIQFLLERRRSFFYDEILYGLTEMSFSGTQGRIKIVGERAEALLTGVNGLDVFLGVSEYGHGRMFLAAHDRYTTWFKQRTGGLEGKFISNVKKWLTKGAVANDFPKKSYKTFESPTLDLNNSDKNTDFNRYRLCFWHPSVELSDEMAEKLRIFISNGGGLFAGITFWATAAAHNGNYEASSIYRFFKNYGGMVLEKSYFELPRDFKVHENKAASLNSYNSLTLEKSYFNYYEVILNNLTEIPVSGTPGRIKIVGKRAEALFTGEKATDVFLGVSEYGNGRMFLAAHDCYTTWFKDKNGGIEGKLISNIKKWLTKGAGADDSQTLDLNNSDKNTDFNRYRLCFWHPSVELSDEMAEKLRIFISNGGGLFAGITFWTTAAARNGNYEASSMYRFFKNYGGLVLENSYSRIQSKATVKENLAKNVTEMHALEVSNKTYLHYCHVAYTNLLYQYHKKDKNQDDIEKARRVQNALENQIFKMKNWTAIPSSQKPVRSRFEKIITNTLLMSHMVSGAKAKNIYEFPGDFRSPLPSSKSNILIRLETKFAERISTGYYLPAGIDLIVFVNNGNFTKWKIRIGPHSDILPEDHEEYRRWPICSIMKDLDRFSIVSSPIGGLIYFESETASELEVTISNVVEAPYFDVTNPEHTNNWETIKNKPGLWAEIAGKKIIFTIPSSSIRELDNAKEIIDYWDELVRLYHDLRGSYDADERRRERVVPDVQPIAGYMHSGYPIVTHMDIINKTSENFILNYTQMKRYGNWELFQVLGFQMHRSEWTFDGAWGVTNNIFAIYGMYSLCNIEILKHPWFEGLEAEIRSYFTKKPTYEDWKKNHRIALATFVQLIRAYGWQPMKKFMRYNEADIKYNINPLPSSNQDKIDKWVIRYSKIIQRNIKPQFQMWGLPVSSTVDRHVHSFSRFDPKPEDYLIIKN